MLGALITLCKCRDSGTTDNGSWKLALVEPVVESRIFGRLKRVSLPPSPVLYREHIYTYSSDSRLGNLFLTKRGNLDPRL